MSNFFGEVLRKFNAALDRATPLPALSVDGVVAAIEFSSFSVRWLDAIVVCSMARRHLGLFDGLAPSL
jgi:hypothetical protein